MSYKPELYINYYIIYVKYCYLKIEKNIGIKHITMSNVSEESKTVNNCSENNMNVDEDTFQITIKGITGQSYTITCCNDDSILSIKQQLVTRLGIELDVIRLIYSGKQLTDDQTVGGYGIENDSTVHMVNRLRGGKKNFKL